MLVLPSLVQPATIYLLQILSSQIACFSVRSSLVKLSALCNQIEIFYIITLKLSHISEGNLMYYHISIIKFHNFINKSRNISKWKKCSEGDLSECSRVCEDCEGNISLSRYWWYLRYNTQRGERGGIWGFFSAYYPLSSNLKLIIPGRRKVLLDF